ncbi:TIGR02757 family protein [Treponema parvum]|uniref:TIGR02757 family protein n=1 Tax=Treponema parvum TaxID=138851 RepID=A0A975F134_9SPIR|nr:TIGR02757 family protein [Treponema parvum]QTQ12428.1 TIGR02757 family protein [Treponema parvum]
MNKISDETKKLLLYLADKYETPEFSSGDPSLFLRRYNATADIEICSFIASLFAFGQRRQFLKKIDEVLAYSGDSFADWLKDGSWKNDFPSGTKKYYRFYSYDDVRDVFNVLQKILSEYGTLGGCVRREYEKNKALANAVDDFSPVRIFSELFKNCRMVSHTKQSANKRLHMFLRWMVRKNSPVDVGLWDWYPAEKLIIPLDTHVLQQAKKLHLVPEKSAASAKTAFELTEILKQVWPDDPCRGDFALFGMGVDEGLKAAAK